MSNLGHGKPVKSKIDSKMSVQTKLANLDQYGTMLNLKMSGTQTTKGVFSSSIHRPLLQLDMSSQGPNFI
jgi:hypothetical protein